MDPHPYLVGLAQAGSESLRTGILSVPPHERDFLEAWCRDTLSNYASTVNTPALSRTPSSLMGMISPSEIGGFASASASTAGLASPPSDTLIMSPGPNGGCKDLFRSIPLDAVLYELELLLEEARSGLRNLSDLADRPSIPLSFTSTTSSSGTISSFTTPENYTFAQHPTVAFSHRSSAGLSPMQQLIAEGPRSNSLGGGVRSAGRARAGSFAVRGIA